MIRRAIHITYKAARRIVVGVVGGTVVLIGVIMLVTPGPALIVIPVAYYAFYRNRPNPKVVPQEA